MTRLWPPAPRRFRPPDLPEFPSRFGAVIETFDVRLVAKCLVCGYRLYDADLMVRDAVPRTDPLPPDEFHVMM